MGNLNAERDWGYAPEYVEAMWTMLQQSNPDDYVIGTGESHSVIEFLDAACAYAGLDREAHVEIDKNYFRPREVNSLRADCRLAREKLDWKPKIRFLDLVKIMMDYDLTKAGLACPGEGIRALERAGFGWAKDFQEPRAQ